MTALNSKSIAVGASLVSFVFVVLMTVPFGARADACRLDREQWLRNTSAQLGDVRMLGQTFINNRPGRVCRVKVYIAKTNPAAGPLTLSILNVANVPIDSATIPGPPIPMGASVQLFDFECDGAPLAGAPFRLKLESPASALGHYRWFGSGANPFAAGQAWSNSTGVWKPLGNGGADFMFKIYMCNE
jgi:hypothetical protein